MLNPRFAPALAALAPALVAMPVWGPVRAQDVELAQLSIHERITVRVQKMVPVARPKPIRWKEKKGPKCVSPGDMAGVLISEPGSVDMAMYGGQWLRAKLDGRCRTLDFYSGIYLKPGTDGRVCADRDVIRARSGAKCEIATFKTLERQK